MPRKPDKYGVTKTPKKPLPNFNAPPPGPPPDPTKPPKDDEPIG